VAENSAGGVRDQVRSSYGAAANAITTGATNSDVLTAASCCGSSDSADVGTIFGAGLYGADEHAELPAETVEASLGCGNPTAVAELHPGQRVLDLGSGGGLDVLLSARRVGPDGFVYGIDMTDEMLAAAEANKANAGATNVEFRKGTIEDIPLADASVDIVISNCVINLSTDKPAVLAEIFRVLVPGGRIGISDVVAEDHLSPDQRAERGSYVGCIAGALSQQEYRDELTATGFTDASVTFTHEVAKQIHGAIVTATKPVTPSN
jgi:ubiquinone/menaquinone biosynthesis C-methylase UbiE